MRTVSLIAGVVCLFAVLFDAFQTIILPRRATGRFRLTRISILLPGNHGPSSPSGSATCAGEKLHSVSTDRCR